MVEIDGDGNRTYALGTERRGGMMGYWFCRTCNTERTCPWDEEHTRWVPELFNALQAPSSSGNTLKLGARDLDPGAFGRCLWAWFFAVADGLLDRVPDVAAAVRTGAPITHPGYPRVFLAATRELQFGMFIGHYGGSITAPPYAAYISGPRWETRQLARAWFDVTPWLAERPGHRREVDLTLPIVETMGEEGLPMLGHPVLD